MTLSPWAQTRLLTPSAQYPTRGSAGAAGLDICADLLDATGAARMLRVGRTSLSLTGTDAEGRPFFRLRPGCRVLIPTGIAMVTSTDLYSRVAPRSGLALLDGIAILGGVVDCDYTGEIGVICLNTDPVMSFDITHGMRIAQVVFEQTWLGTPEQVQTLRETDRGAGGFGSTGR